MVLLSEALFFNSKRETTRGLDLIALGSLDIIRAAVCFALESAIVGRRLTGRRLVRDRSRRSRYDRPDGYLMELKDHLFGQFRFPFMFMVIWALLIVSHNDKFRSALSRRMAWKPHHVCTVCSLC